MKHQQTPPPCMIPEKLAPALEALLQAYKYALDTNSTVWDFAISIRRLLSLGVSETDLRWFVRRGFTEHGREVTVEGDDGREFRPTGNLTFSRRTCFVLTSEGVAVAEAQCARPQNGRAVLSLPGSNGHQGGRPLLLSPHWNSSSRKLQLNDQLVKCFRWPAVNQEAVLCAFQEEGWPERIDDPLPPQPEQDVKRRLADTIKCLNRKQVNELVHFRGDGTGEGVVWELVERTKTPANA